MSTNTYSLNLEASSSQYASITDASQTGLDFSGDLTFECWLKVESEPGTSVRYELVNKWGATDAGRAYAFAYAKTSGGVTRLQIKLRDGTTTDNLNVNTTLTVGSWVHIAVTFDASASTAEFFVDGSSIGTATGSITSIQNTTTAFAIGAEPASGQYYDGLIDEVRVWSDIRTSTEIVDNMSVQLNGDEANLEGYWRFNNDYLDQTANNNDLTATNSPSFSVDIPFDGGTIEVSNTTGSFIYQSGVFDGQWLSQSFTTSGAFSLKSLNFLAYKVGTPTTDIDVGIYASSGEEPTGSALGTTTLDPTTFSTDTGGVEVKATFASAISLSASTKYVIRFSISADDGSNCGNFKKNTATYSGGQALYSTNDGSTWLADGPSSDADWYFEAISQDAVVYNALAMANF